jgi:hypothetical protein
MYMIAGITGLLTFARPFRLALSLTLICLSGTIIWFRLPVAGSLHAQAQTARLASAAVSKGHGSTHQPVKSPLPAGTLATELKKLTASDGVPGDLFGYDVALSEDSNTLVIGAQEDDANGHFNLGSAYVFVRAGNDWIQQAQLLPDDGAPADSFGQYVSISGETIVVGSPEANVNGFHQQGAAYVFVRNGTVWTQQQKLIANDGQGDEFGVAVIDGDTIAVAAHNADIDGKVNQGAVYIFVRNGTTWTQQHKLTTLDGQAHDQLGERIALSGDTLLVGGVHLDIGSNTDQGAAYVFVRNGTTWTQQQKLVASDGAAGDQFGRSVAVRGNYALIGASSDDQDANGNQGSAYFFARNGATWAQLQKLTAADGAAGDQFGVSVAIQGTTLAVGALFADVGATANQGAAYVFRHNGTNWVQQDKLSSSDGGTGQWFGWSLALRAAGSAGNDLLVAGALRDNNNQGAAYLFSSASSCIAPTITTNPANQTATAGATATFTAAANGNPAPSVRWQVSTDGGAIFNDLPGQNRPTQQNATLTLNNVSYAQHGYQYRAVFTNACGSTNSAAATLSVTCPTVTVGPASISPGTVGSSYSQTFTQTGGSGVSTWDLSAGALPNGLALSPAGVLSGIPTASGNFNFTVRATAVNGCQGAQTYTITITCPGLIINPTTLPEGRAQQPYPATTITATGSVGPYTFGLSAGQLPGGLNLINSVLMGTPNQAGVFNFSVTANDAAGCTGTHSYTLRIRRGVVRADFDGDGKSDLSVWRGATGNWAVLQSSNNATQNLLWGAGYAPYFDVPVPGDYDGDGKTDHAIWRGQDSIWYIRKSSDGDFILDLWGASYAPYFDIPVPGDYDGDGKTDLAVWRRDGIWYVKRSSDGSYLIQVQGQNGDVPVPADYDGDGKTDLAIFRPSASAPNWFIRQSLTGAVVSFQWGGGYAPYFDQPVPADYDGDGKADLAIWRGQDSIWYIQPSASPSNPLLKLWGANYAPYNDIPVPGDYDGDGKADIAVWRRDGTWYVIRSSNSSFLIQAHGLPGDLPVPAYGVR